VEEIFGILVCDSGAAVAAAIQICTLQELIPIRWDVMLERKGGGRHF